MLKFSFYEIINAELLPILYLASENSKLNISFFEELESSEHLVSWDWGTYTKLCVSQPRGRLFY